MVKGLIQRIDNRLEALMSGYFKPARGGGKLFFPRGIWGRGYVVASEQDYKRLVRQIKVLWALGIALLFLGGIALNSVVNGYPALLISSAFVVLLYFIAGAPYLVSGMQPSDERMTLRDSYASQAVAHSSRTLWSWEITGLIGVGVGVVMLFVDSSNWPTALAVIAFSSVGAAAVMWMIVLRRRHRTRGRVDDL